MLPLDGVFVLDLSRVLSGPFGTLQLADLGAEVIKVENPDGGDDTRRFGPPFINGESTYFMSVNRKKRSIALDLKDERAKEIVRALAEKADVVIENFRPGTLDRLGLSLESLRKRALRLVTCSISGYGPGGSPDFAGRPGYDAVVQAASGLMSVTGQPDGPPTRVGVAIADLVSGMFATQGILAALVERSRTGVGKHVEIAMLDSMISLMTYQAAIQLGTGKTPQRMGDAHPSICPYETVDVRDGRYMLAVGNDGQFKKLVELLELPSLSLDPRFVTNAARVVHRRELMELIGPALRSKTADEWDRVFAAVGVPGGPVLDLAAALGHEHFVARGGILSHQHPVAGEVRTLASPVRFEDTEPEAGLPPPLLGQHTREVLREKLGMSIEDIDALIARGIAMDPS